MTQKDKIVPVQDKKEEKEDILANPKYICTSCTIITESLKRGSDVVQMPNGDIIVREPKIIITKFGWDKKKEKVVRLSSEIEQELEEEAQEEAPEAKSHSQNI